MVAVVCVHFLLCEPRAPYSLLLFISNVYVLFLFCFLALAVSSGFFFMCLVLEALRKCNRRWEDRRWVVSMSPDGVRAPMASARASGCGVRCLGSCLF